MTSQPSTGARYTLTARLGSAWRWASFNLMGSGKKRDAMAISTAEQVIQNRIDQAKAQIAGGADEPEKLEEAIDVWTNGGATLANPNGIIIWTRPTTRR